MVGVWCLELLLLQDQQCLCVQRDTPMNQPFRSSLWLHHSFHIEKTDVLTILTLKGSFLPSLLKLLHPIILLNYKCMPILLPWWRDGIVSIFLFNGFVSIVFKYFLNIFYQFWSILLKYFCISDAQLVQRDELSSVTTEQWWVATCRNHPITLLIHLYSIIWPC